MKLLLGNLDCALSKQKYMSYYQNFQIRFISRIFSQLFRFFISLLQVFEQSLFFLNVTRMFQKIWEMLKNCIFWCQGGGKIFFF